MRTQELAVDIKGKTSVKKYRPLGVLDYRLLEIGRYVISFQAAVFCLREQDNYFILKQQG